MDIIVNPIGGLANRMRAIASGIALCNDYDIKIKEVIWPVNEDLFCPFEKLFEPVDNVKIINISSLKQLFYYDEPRKKNLKLSRLFQINRYSGKVINQHPAIINYINSFSNSNKPLLIQSGLIYYDFTPELYRSLFTPLKELDDMANDRLSSAGTPIIGLHIRRTDNIVSIEKSPTELFIKAMNKEVSENKEVKFYLATDDDQTKKQLKSIFGESKVICSETTASRNTETGIKEALTEMLCLMKCDKIYGSYYSSYSEAAAMLGNKQLKQLKI